MCRFPMLATQYYDFGKGKNIVKFISKWDPDEDYTKLKIKYMLKGQKIIVLPCGKCTDCRLQKSREWADRCMLEAKEHDFNYFLTLTYDDEHVPRSQGINTETGELYETLTLKPKDLQDFFKRLRITYKRKYNTENIRFYACGEYGDLYQRPHYHAIMFGLPIYDLRADHKSKKGNMNYTSEEIQKIWGKGRIAVGNVTWESCAYTARYVMKKQTGKGSEEYYRTLGVVPEFVRMSRKPGIARNYYEEKKDIIYDTDEIYLSTSKGVVSAKPSRYYDKLFDLENHEQLEEIKRRRKENAEDRQRMLLYGTDLSASDVLQIKHDSKDIAIKSLKRDYETGKNNFV